MLAHKQIIIKGQVENTGFRFHALRGAYAFSIKGAVTQKDGDIIIEAEGEPKDMDQFIAWCSKGTMYSKVSKIDVVNKNVYGYSDFKIS